MLQMEYVTCSGYRVALADTQLQLWQCWQTGALTYLLMMLRSRLKSILQTAPAATALCNRDVKLSADLRERYLQWIFPPVSIAHHRRRHHHRRRRRVCDSEEQRSLSRLLWLSWHPLVEPCSDRAIQRAPRTDAAAAGYISGDGSRRANLTTSGWMGSSLRLVLVCWRVLFSQETVPHGGSLSVSRSVVARDVAVTRSVHNAQPSDDYAAHARWAMWICEKLHWKLLQTTCKENRTAVKT